ncbi:MAG: DinB family protein [Anaerolineae bacterium]
MNPEQMTLAEIYQGWEEYQRKIVAALAPLTAEQLAFRAAPSLRPIGNIAAHMIGARARWFHNLLGEGGAEMEALARSDRPGTPTLSATELVQRLEATWRLMTEARTRWTPADWERTYPGEDGDPTVLTKSWVIWHLIEHDAHHGGEISLTLGMHGLAAPDL